MMLAALLVRSGFVSIIMGLHSRATKKRMINQNVAELLNALESQEW